MANVKKSKIVPYSAKQMFHLIDDIKAYPEFLPWCGGSTEHLRDEDSVKASILIAMGVVRKSFTTLNRLQANKMIEIRLVDGPFKHLEGFWRFDSLSDNECKVSFDLEFEFAGRLISLALGPIFHQITVSMLDAFCQRADALYGAES